MSGLYFLLPAFPVDSCSPTGRIRDRERQTDRLWTSEGDQVRTVLSLKKGKV
jgi:hypothetical protein